MSRPTNNMSEELFKVDGKTSVGETLPLALQHVVAMIVGCVTPAIIVAGVAGLSEQDSVILIQAALTMSAITTLIQVFPLLRTGKIAIGSGLPVIMGISFAYVPTMQAIAGRFDIATILGAQIVGGIVAVFVGIFIKQIRKFFPPLITGTVVFAIGLSLYPTAINYMAGGASNESYGSWENWLVAIITLCIVTALNHYGKGIWKLASILIGIIAGYIISLFFGMVDFSAVVNAFSKAGLDIPVSCGGGYNGNLKTLKANNAEGIIDVYIAGLSAVALNYAIRIMDGEEMDEETVIDCAFIATSNGYDMGEYSDVPIELAEEGVNYFEDQPDELIWPAVPSTFGLDIPMSVITGEE